MRRESDRLRDILDACDLIATIIAGRTKADLAVDSMLGIRLLYQIMMVGEASKNLAPTSTHVIRGRMVRHDWNAQPCGAHVHGTQ